MYTKGFNYISSRKTSIIEHLGFHKPFDYSEIKIFCMASISTTNNTKVVKRHVLSCKNACNIDDKVLCAACFEINKKMNNPIEQG